MSGRHLPVLFYSYSVDGQEYADDMGRNPEALPRFYGFLKDGKLPSTSQIKGEIRICDIGTIIAAHCGPGTVAVFFFGDERAPYNGK